MVKEIKLNKNAIPFNKDLTICLGFFDGVHLGHQELVIKAKKISTNDVAVLSIDKKGEKNLTSSSDRCRFFNMINVDHFYSIDFDAIKELSPIEFIKDYLLPLGVKNIVIGEDFKFGKNRSGDIKDLKEYFNVYTVPFLTHDNKKISSTSLIDIIHDGDVKKYHQLTNRYYEIKGRVISGLRNGKKLGFPTANIRPSDNYCLPKQGVYKTYIYVFGIPRLSVTNIGYHPTINRLNEMIIETHILDFDMEIYDAPIYLAFIERIRDEITFKNVDELKAQLKKDIESVRNDKKQI